MKFVCMLFAASLTLSSLSAVAAADQTLHLTPAASIEIPDSKGKFDFLRIDSKRNRLLAAHENDGTSDFFDLKKNTLMSRLKVGGPVDTVADVCRDVGRDAARGDGVQHLVVDKSAHVLPAALLGQRVELGL